MTDHPERTPNIPCPGPRLSRRGALLGLAAGLTLGGTRLAFGQGAPGEARLVVVLLRGGLDSLSAVPAYGDPAF
ncbi:MAG TPA: hypothetical protein VE684_01535, partial [Crenalkalicoccus sp.]|nr:hypothetical protein [Crenalkalicoccus sp.]